MMGMIKEASLFSMLDMNIKDIHNERHGSGGLKESFLCGSGLYLLSAPVVTIVSAAPDTSSLPLSLKQQDRMSVPRCFSSSQAGG